MDHLKNRPTFSPILFRTLFGNQVPGVRQRRKGNQWSDCVPAIKSHSHSWMSNLDRHWEAFSDQSLSQTTLNIQKCSRETGISEHLTLIQTNLVLLLHP